MIKSDPFSNLGTSKVFYELLSGPKSPKQIADSLGIKPPPVIEQLRRLQKIGVVQIGKKNGKFQNYEINFEKFLELFIDRALREKRTYPSNLHADEIKKIKSLKSNEYFKKFIVNYLKNLDSPMTIADAANEFEDGLLHSGTLDRNRKFNDSEMQEFFNTMRLWRKIAKKKMTYAELALLHSLTVILNPKRFKN